LETLKVGAARIDLEGNPVGTVHRADEEDAKEDRQAIRCDAAKAIRTAGRQTGPRPDLLRGAHKKPDFSK
jgi:sRNA-binding protein